MKILSHIQIVLVVIFSLLASPMIFAQLADPIFVNLKSSGSSYADQFPASTNYSYGIVEFDSPQLGIPEFIQGAGNTLKVMFTPDPGAVGTANLIVTYYTLSAPVYPVTKAYIFNVSS